MEDLRTVVAPHGMLLVTEDGGLAMLGGLLRASDGSGGRVSPEALHRVVNVPAFEDARAAMRLRRRSAAPVIPDLATVRSIAAALERRINVPPLEMTVLEPGLRVVPDLSLMLGLLKALDGRSGAALLDEIVRIRVNNAGDLLHAALIMVQILTDDNARERGRESTESLASVALGLREGAGMSSDIPGAGERLAAAWVRRDEVLGNSLLRQVEVVDPTLYIPALVWVILIVQALIADTADELEESAEVVLHRLIAQLTAEVSNAGS